MSIFEVSDKDSCGDLKIDQICILLTSDVGPVNFKYQSLECEKCPLARFVSFGRETISKKLDLASLGTVWDIGNEKNETLCSPQNTYFDEGSTFSLHVNNSGCFISETIKNSSVYIPLAVALAIYIIIGLLWILCKFIYRKKIWERILNSTSSLDELAAAYSSSSTFDESKQRQTKQRLRSLDTVRGISIVVMIFVNYGGGGYWFFHHARWNGLTVADLVFPWFIWMMGMSMALSLKSLLRKSIPRQIIFYRILKRSVILFGIGLILNTMGCTPTDLQSLRISGVLQRFGVSYFIVASIHTIFARIDDSDEQHSFYFLRDITFYWMEWIVMLLFLIVHILLTFFVHDIGCPPGYLGPGGWHDEGNYSLCTGGAAGYIDRKILGEQHLYKAHSVKEIYNNELNYDPEGILGYFTSIFLVFLGLQAGKILLIYSTSKSRIIRWLGWSCVTGVLSLILCNVSKDDGWIPINKNLWSVSFIFATGSLAFLLMSICYFIIDVQKWWSGAPFFYSGMNSIFLYVGHEITHNMFPWCWKVASSHSNHLALNLWGTSIWVIISIYAYYAKFFVTI